MGPESGNRNLSTRSILKPLDSMHERRDDGIDGVVAGGELLGDAVNHVDGDRRQRSAPPGSLAQVRLRLDREDAGHLARIVSEVEAVAGPDLDDAAGQAREQPAPPVGAALSLDAGADARIHPGEDRVAGARRHQVTGSRVRPPVSRSARTASWSMGTARRSVGIRWNSRPKTACSSIRASAAPMQNRGP